MEEQADIMVLDGGDQGGSGMPGVTSDQVPGCGQ